MASVGNRLFAFDRSRTPSPEVFENNFDGESDDDIEAVQNVGDAIHKEYNQTRTDTQTKVKNITKPNFTSRQFSNDKIVGENVDQWHDMPNHVDSDAEDYKLVNHSGDPLNGDLAAEGRVDETTSAIPSSPKSEPAVARIKHKHNEEQNKPYGNEDFESWNEVWNLEEDDLLETRESVDSTIRIDPFLTKSVRESVRGHRQKAKVCWGKYQKYPRLYHIRSSRESKDSTTATLQKSMTILQRSPLTILANMAEKSQMELTTLLDSYDSHGINTMMPVRFPCMQCYEKQGLMADGGYDSYYGGPSDPYYDDYGYESADNDKCKKCGGTVQTMSTFIKMLKELKLRIEKNKLVVHDVYPDGNCLFGAVVDQLRIRGVFDYTIHNMREASVEYLRQNPISSDGETHFELFLTDETWDQYLTRMSKDGEWGDHMILSAISNVTHQRIVIFGGRSGEGQTIILPTDMQEPENVTDKEQTNDESNSKPKEQPTDSTSAKSSAATSTESSTATSTKSSTATSAKSSTTTSAKSSTATSAKSSTATSTESPKATGEREILSFDKKATIFLGHFGESHYVSLRPKDWEERLLCTEEQPSRVESGRRRLQSSDQSTRGSKIPIYHLNFLLRQTFQLEYVTSSHSKRTDFLEISKNSKEATEEGVGDVINKLAPCFDDIQLLGPDVGLFLPSERPRTSNTPKPTDEVDEAELFTYLHIPNDSKVVESTQDIRKFDFLAEVVENSPDLVRLLPCRPDKWQGSTSRGSSKYLLAMDPFQGENKLMSFAMPWPRQARSWTTRVRPAHWPDISVIRQIEEGGCHVIPLIYAIEFEEFRHDNCMVTDEQIDDSLWTVTFAVPERTLAQSSTQAQKHVFYVFDLLVKNILHEKDFPKVACKHIFYHACENISQYTWETSPATCLLLLMKKLSEYMERGFIPHYFMPTKNLLHGITTHVLQYYSRKIEFARHMPMAMLFFLLDKHTITSTEIGSFMDCMIEDTTKCQVEEDIQRTVLECFVPASCGLLETSIYQGDYGFVLNIILCLKEEMVKWGVEGPSMSQIVINGLWKMHCGYQWCVALYCDIKQGTLITKDVVEGLSSVHITQVFGPESTSVLPDTLVPSALGPSYGQLNFPAEVVKVLKCVGDTKALSICLRYYLDTYDDVFFGQTQGSRLSLYMAGLLFNLYVSLFDCYDDNGEIDEFKDLLPRFIEAGEDLGTANAFKILERICKRLGEHGKAKAFRKKPTGLILLM